jgi:nicotinate-nucleotide adenylyltransferase
MYAKKRVALYGGTFDPVHLGHLEVARKVAELFEIEKVLFVPAQVAPHKVGRPVTASMHRYAMLVLATENDAKLFVSTFEIEAPDRHYTVDTLTHFQKSLGETSELFFIMGADSWSEITTWREWERLLTMVNHIVVTRPGYEIEERIGMDDRIVDLTSSDADRPLLHSSSAPQIFFTDVVMKDVSATQIRMVAGAGRFAELAQLVPGPVAEYIKKYGIYQESNEA